jgi:hypothetical protein
LQAFHDFDEDEDGAITAHDLKLLTSATGLVRCSPAFESPCADQPRLQGWSSKDVMRLLGVSTRDKKKTKEPMLIDFLQFVDAVVEVHGDPFYELRYRCATAAAFARARH